ncbi:MAG: isoprenylcysteine carboxylmethyltransferase family protein [Flammeovirgaceae bacterium]|nr:MAG: isoprenylcysteine carboxylmethyltransferase family protein [Flammeovirgaceae bacterium]
MDHIYLAFAWGTYFFLHSYLASSQVKDSVKKTWPQLAVLYRLLYVVVSTTGLAGIGWLLTGIPSRFDLEPSPALQVTGIVVLLTGVVIILLSFRQYSFTGFIGLRNDAHDTLQTNGLLKYVRHPIYAGTVLIVLGFSALSPTSTVLVSVLCIFTYLPVGIYLEEKKLIALYGQTYRDYRKCVPAVFPKLKF